MTREHVPLADVLAGYPAISRTPARRANRRPRRGRRARRDINADCGTLVGDTPGADGGRAVPWAQPQLTRVDHPNIYELALLIENSLSQLYRNLFIIITT